MKKNLDYLFEKMPLEFFPFYDAFSAFAKVVKSCYGYKLSRTYKEDITSFASAYRQLNINDTTKIHIVTEHLVEFIEKSSKLLGKKTGLAVYTGLLSDFTLLA